jgi:hypothetical protein
MAGDFISESWAISAGISIDMDGAPRSYKTGLAVKSRPISALVTDYERKAAFVGAPYLQLLCRRTNTAEVQGHFPLNGGSKERV